MRSIVRYAASLNRDLFVPRKEWILVLQRIISLRSYCAAHGTRGRTYAFPRHDLPELCQVSPPKQRGRRECRVRDAPAASRANEKSTRASTLQVTSVSSGIPRANGFNGFLHALPGDRAFLPPSLVDRSTTLAPASGRQNHTTLPSATGAFVLSTTRVHRIPHPTSVTIAIRPSCEAGHRNREVFRGQAASGGGCDRLARRAICAWRQCMIRSWRIGRSLQLCPDRQGGKTEGMVARGEPTGISVGYCVGLDPTARGRRALRAFL
jgi:hypothetical protein